MSVVRRILQYTPEEWSESEYTNEHFELVDVDCNTIEYKKIENEFSEKITKITRIQHPYLYGMYLFRKAQIQLKSVVPEEKIIKPFPNYVGNELSHFINRNCDERLYQIPDKNDKYVIKKKLVTSSECNSNIYAQYIVTVITVSENAPVSTFPALPEVESIGRELAPCLEQS